MPLFGDDQGKTEKPTPSRLSEVRNKGDSPMSKELVQGGVLMVVALSFEHCGSWLMDALEQTMRRGLDVGLDDRTLGAVPGACRELLGAVLLVVPPFAALVATLVLATLVLGYGQIGVRWSREVLGLKFERLNPLTNWKKVFNVQALVRTGFAVLKLATIVSVLWYVLRDQHPAHSASRRPPLRGGDRHPTGARLAAGAARRSYGERAGRTDGHRREAPDSQVVCPPAWPADSTTVGWLRSGSGVRSW
jgi:flagellar biosynthesis protein FlhB